MMKVSDPIIFGHAVEAYFSALFAEHAATLDELGVSANDGLASLTAAIQELPADQRAAIEAGLKRRLAEGHDHAIDDSERGITNLHVPNHSNVDSSSPSMLRSQCPSCTAAGQQQTKTAA